MIKMRRLLRAWRWFWHKHWSALLLPCDACGKFFCGRCYEKHDCEVWEELYRDTLRDGI